MISPYQEVLALGSPSCYEKEEHGKLTVFILNSCGWLYGFLDCEVVEREVRGYWEAKTPLKSCLEKILLLALFYYRKVVRLL